MFQHNSGTPGGILNKLGAHMTYYLEKKYYGGKTYLGMGCDKGYIENEQI